MLTGLTFASALGLIILSSNDGSLTTVDARSSKRNHQTFPLHDRKVCSVSLHPNQLSVATASLDRSVKVFDLRKIDGTKPVLEYTHEQVSFFISPDIFAVAHAFDFCAGCQQRHVLSNQRLGYRLYLI